VADLPLWQSRAGVAVQPFFITGKKYRVPMFLATSFRKQKAQDFIDGSSADALVLWKVKLHPHDRCHHVNLVRDTETHVEGECEFLFVPYSAFTVESVTCSRNPQDPIT
jgi:hypothetical protein